MIVSVQYQEYDIHLFLMILPYRSLHCMLVSVQYPEYDINQIYYFSSSSFPSCPGVMLACNFVGNIYLHLYS